MNPLEQLKPLMAPPVQGWWPPAPGWWLLAALLVLSLWTSGWLFSRRRNRNPQQAQPLPDAYRLSAARELASLPRPYDTHAGPWLQQINSLLKRLCRVHYPEHNCVTLSGRAWLAFLDNRCPAAGLTRWMVLVEGGYRVDCRLDDKAVDGLYQAVDTWIRQHV